MLTFIRGELVGFKEESLIISLGGVGIEVMVSPTTNDKMSGSIGNEVEFFTYFTFIASKNTMIPLLIGFEREEEREIFEKLLIVPGIGAKVALSILSLDVEKLASAINEGRVDILTGIPGIGKSKARQIITSLAGKVVLEKDVKLSGPRGEMWDTARSALLKLGFNNKEIEQILQRVSREIEEPETVEEIINKAFER